MFTKVLIAVSICLLPALLPAQTGSFTNFGIGCKGSAPGSCLNNNGGGGTLESLSSISANENALEVVGNRSAVISGFEIFTAAKKKTTVKAFFFLANAAGAPLSTPALTGSITVDIKVGWYRATFTRPFIIKPLQKFFISWDVPGQPFSLPFREPIIKNGKKATSYWRNSNQPNFPAWRGPISQAWAWRVICPAVSSVPFLTHSGTPRIANSYSVDLSQALPASVGLLITGISNKAWGPFRLPLSLKAANAPGCSLLVSFDLLLSIPISASGTSAFSFPIPNDPRLVKQSLHHQWAVIDSKANGLGIAFSNGGTALIGK